MRFKRTSGRHQTQLSSVTWKPGRDYVALGEPGRETKRAALNSRRLTALLLFNGCAALRTLFSKCLERTSVRSSSRAKKTHKNGRRG
eukprot:6484135-Amphidinium_carterae.1